MPIDNIDNSDAIIVALAAGILYWMFGRGDRNMDVRDYSASGSGYPSAGSRGPGGVR